MEMLTVTTAMIDHCIDGELWSKYADFIEKYGESAATNILLNWLYDEIFDEIQKNAFPEIRPLLWDFLAIIFYEIDGTELENAALEKFRGESNES